jgi:hypothetical protein
MDAAANVEWVLCGGGFRGDGKEQTGVLCSHGLLFEGRWEVEMKAVLLCSHTLWLRRFRLLEILAKN